MEGHVVKFTLADLTAANVDGEHDGEHPFRPPLCREKLFYELPRNLMVGH
jgi:hypothetical protein